MISFCVSILSYVWRTGAVDDPSDGIRPPLSDNAALAIRTVVTVIFTLGVLYFVLIMRTFGRYSEREAGRKWKPNVYLSRPGPRPMSSIREGLDALETQERGRTSRQERRIGESATGLGLTGVTGHPIVNSPSQAQLDINASKYTVNSSEKGIPLREKVPAKL